MNVQWILIERMNAVEWMTDCERAIERKIVRTDERIEWMNECMDGCTELHRSAQKVDNISRGLINRGNSCKCY